MVYDKAQELAKMLGECQEYKDYRASKEKALQNDTTKALLKEYHQLQLRAQAAMVSGERDDEVMERLRKTGEILQFNKEASEFLMNEFRMNRVLGDIYRILAEAVDMDLDMLEN